MPELDQRLAGCFATVFPDLSEGEIPRASHTSVANWDSLATVTLVSVIEEEFNVPIRPEDFEFMISFELVLDCLRRRTGNGS
jgi:acyl carrier protein